MFNKFNKSRKTWEQGYEEGRRDGVREVSERHDQYRRKNLEMKVGTPLIVVPNEWSNPVIGFGKEIINIGMSPVLVIDNYLTGKEVICGGVMMAFSRQKLDVILRLDPYELWAITAHNTVGCEEFTKPKSEERWEPQAILDKLEESGFFERFDSFMKKEERDWEEIRKPKGP